MKDTFSEFHPVINIGYFALLITFTMIFFDIFFLPLSFLGAFVYGLHLGNKNFIKIFLVFVLPIVVLSAVINMYLNQTGDNIIWQYKHTIITWEALTYGITSGLSFGAVIMWCYSYNKIITSDKFLFVFGKIVPTLALIFSMVLKFVPQFGKRAKLISTGQKAIGKNIGTGSIKERTHQGTRILSIMVTWSLENSIDTSDSMKARGYGLKGRTNFTTFIFSNRDILWGVLLIFLAVVTVIGIPYFGTKTFFYPHIEVVTKSGYWKVIYLFAGVLSFLPMIINVREKIRWIYLKSKI